MAKTTHERKIEVLESLERDVAHMVSNEPQSQNNIYILLCC